MAFKEDLGGHWFLIVLCMGAVLTLINHCVLQFKRKAHWMLLERWWTGEWGGGQGKTIVVFSLPSEIFIILEVLPVRPAVALPLHFKVHMGNDWYFIKLFSFFNLLPKEISTSVKQLAVYIVLLFSFISELSQSFAFV